MFVLLKVSKLLKSLNLDISKHVNLNFKEFLGLQIQGITHAQVEHPPPNLCAPARVAICLIFYVVKRD